MTGEGIPDEADLFGTAVSSSLSVFVRSKIKRQHNSTDLINPVMKL